MPKRAPVEGKAKLVLRITVKGKATEYGVSILDPDLRVADAAVRLTKPNGESYDVHQDEDGFYCTCADFYFCRGFTEKKCKHIEALKASGLLGDH